MKNPHRFLPRQTLTKSPEQFVASLADIVIPVNVVNIHVVVAGAGGVVAGVLFDGQHVVFLVPVVQSLLTTTHNHLPAKMR